LADNEKNSNVIFSLQLSSNKHIIYNQIIYPSQYPGVIYPHFLLKNEIALFQGMKPKNGASKINFNMKSLMGFPDMHYDSCYTYPDYFMMKINLLIYLTHIFQIKCQFIAII